MHDLLLGIDPLLIYVAVGLLAWGESVSFLSLLLPGEVTLVAAAAMAPLTGVDPLVLGVVAGVSAALGGWCGYLIGRRFGPVVLGTRQMKRRLSAHLPAIKVRLASRWGWLAIVGARFNQVTRAVVPAVAGVAGMNGARFVTANGLGAAVWATAFTLVGVFAADWWRHSSSSVQVVLAAGLAALAGTWFALSRGQNEATPGETGAASSRSPEEVGGGRNSKAGSQAR